MDSNPPTGLTVLDNWVFGFGWIRWVSSGTFHYLQQLLNPAVYRKCIAEDDGVRSCFTELQSFTLSKL